MFAGYRRLILLDDNDIAKNDDQLCSFESWRSSKSIAYKVNARAKVSKVSCSSSSLLFLFFLPNRFVENALFLTFENLLRFTVAHGQTVRSNSDSYTENVTFRHNLRINVAILQTSEDHAYRNSSTIRFPHLTNVSHLPYLLS